MADPFFETKPRHVNYGLAVFGTLAAPTAADTILQLRGQQVHLQPLDPMNLIE